MRTAILFGLMLIVLTSCQEAPHDPYAVPVTGTQMTPRVETQKGWNVELQARFYAGYNNNVREILIVTDPSGKKFIAITGCGVTEYHTERQNKKDITVEE